MTPIFLKFEQHWTTFPLHKRTCDLSVCHILTLRYRKKSMGEEQWLEERLALRTEVEQAREEVRKMEERDAARERVGVLETAGEGKEEEQCDRLQTDIAELRSVQVKLFNFCQF